MSFFVTHDSLATHLAVPFDRCKPFAAFNLTVRKSRLSMYGRQDREQRCRERNVSRRVPELLVYWYRPSQPLQLDKSA